MKKYRSHSDLNKTRKYCNSYDRKKYTNKLLKSSRVHANFFRCFFASASISKPTMIFILVTIRLLLRCCFGYCQGSNNYERTIDLRLPLYVSTCLPIILKLFFLCYSHNPSPKLRDADGLAVSNDANSAVTRWAGAGANQRRDHIVDGSYYLHAPHLLWFHGWRPR